MKAISLFSGCGGLDLGLARAGFDVVFAVDNDSFACQSYSANFPDAPLFNGSVTEVTRKLLDDHSAGRASGRIALLAGGPPCPPFSKSRFYRKDKPRALDDDLASETINGYLEVLRLTEPSAFLLENVPGMDYGVHKDGLNHILETARSLGYQCTGRVINAADYGVPQIRHRFILVGMRDRIFEFPEATHASPEARDLFTRQLANWCTAGDAISEFDTEENADDAGHFAGGRYHDLLEQIPPGDNYLFFTEKRGHPQPIFKWRSRYWSFLLKLSPNKPSWTIQARRSNNMGPFHWRNRILRIAEVKRLQTFPDDWILSGNVDRQWRQIGNAVPPILARQIAQAIAQQLSNTGEQATRAA